MSTERPWRNPDQREYLPPDTDLAAFYDTQLGISYIDENALSFDAREAFHRIRSNRRRIDRELLKSPDMMRQAVNITNALWVLIEEIRPEDNDETPAIVEGVTLRLLSGETPMERARRALEHIFGISIGTEVQATITHLQTCTGTKSLRYDVARPIECVLQMSRWVRQIGPGQAKTLEEFHLLEYNEQQARDYVICQAADCCRHFALRDLLLNFRTKESLLLAVAAMLDGMGPIRALSPRPAMTSKRQYRGIRIRRPDDTRRDAENEGVD